MYIAFNFTTLGLMLSWQALNFANFTCSKTLYLGPVNGASEILREYELSLLMSIPQCNVL